MTPIAAAELPYHGSRKCQHDECAFYYEKVLSDRRGGEVGGAKWEVRFLSTRICAYFCGCFQRRPCVRPSVRGRNYFCQLSKHSTTERVRTPPATAACSRLMDELYCGRCVAPKRPTRLLDFVFNRQRHPKVLRRCGSSR